MDLLILSYSLTDISSTSDVFSFIILSHYILSLALCFSIRLDNKVPENSCSFDFCNWFWFVLITFFIIKNLRGAFSRFPDFFVQAFKIVVDSWKFSMLLLCISWDDWPMFMISASNEHLQQQLEYTLLKPYCHRWWISKMQSGRDDTLEERYAIKLCFKLGKSATETYGMLQTAFRPSCMNRASVFEWHKRFKEGRECVRDNERCGRSKEVNTPELIGQRVRLRVTMLRF